MLENKTKLDNSNDSNNDNNKNNNKNNNNHNNNEQFLSCHTKITIPNLRRTMTKKEQQQQ